MVRLFTALVITLIGVTAHAHLSCFSLGFLAADGVSPEMVERTYFDLYDALAKDVGAESIRTLAEGGNPFHLPAGLGEKNPAFAKNVAEFEAMLDRLGWNTDAVRAPILDRLSGLAQRLQKSTKDRAHSVATQENIRRLKWREREDEPDPKLSADGHYFVTLLSGPEATGPASVAVYDLQTGRRQQQELPDSTTSSWTISSDGKSVVFAGGGYTMSIPSPTGGSMWPDAAAWAKRTLSALLRRSWPASPRRSFSRTTPRSGRWRGTTSPRASSSTFPSRR